VLPTDKPRLVWIKGLPRLRSRQACRARELLFRSLPRHASTASSVCMRVLPLRRSLSHVNGAEGSGATRRTRGNGLMARCQPGHAYAAAVEPAPYQKEPGCVVCEHTNCLASAGVSSVPLEAICSCPVKRSPGVDTNCYGTTLLAFWHRALCTSCFIDTVSWPRVRVES
jgi:hypothetical protein